MSQQLVYKVGQYRPRTLGNLTAEQLTVAPGHVVVNDLQTLKETKFPELSWKVDDKKGSAELMEDVIEGNSITPLLILLPLACFSAFIRNSP